jgi:GT2 family glycosyltransferase
VINGGTCPKTREFLSTYSGLSISEKDNGISDAFNKGLKLATGDAVMFLNSGDVLIDKTYIEEVDKIMKENLPISYVHSDILYNDMILGPIHVKSTSKPRSLAKGMPYPHQSLVIRKEIFKKVGGFNQKFKLVMDYDLILRMYKINALGYHVPRMTVCMDGGGVSSREDFTILRENYEALKSNDYLSPAVRSRLYLSYFITTIKMILRKMHCTGLLKIIKRVGRKVEV